MLTYIFIFLNLFTYHILGNFEFNILIERLNVMGLFSISYYFIYEILNTKVFGEKFKLHFFILFIILCLILYNLIVFNKIVLIISVVQLFLFFILDNIFNKITIEYKDVEYPHKKEKETCTDFYEEDLQSEQKDKYKDLFEDLFDDVYEDEKAEEEPKVINIELEEYLVLFDLNQEYNINQLKVSYKKLAQQNHPDKFSFVDKKKQEELMKQINNARTYLEENESVNLTV